MAVKITYFPHATTTDGEKNLSSGWADPPLSEKGIRQAIELKGRIRGKAFAAVFCSDLKRAVDSANLTFAGDCPIITDSRLRECNYGRLNATSSDLVEPLQDKCITDRFPEGESYEDVKNRIADFLDDLKRNYDGKQVAIVAHQAPQLALDILLNKTTWQVAFARDWRKSNAWQPGWDYVLE